MKISVIFPGQGAQTVGMGKDFFELFPESRRLYEHADDCLGFALSKLCFEGPQEQLDSTEMSQPAMLVTSLAMMEPCRERIEGSGRVVEASAGLSLGEYTALCYAGALSLQDAVGLVYKRGQFMKDASEQHAGSMLSVMGLDRAEVEACCREASAHGVIQVANLNCPGQIVISGELAALADVERQLDGRDGVRLTRLAVSGAFHSALMSEAAEKLTTALASVTMEKPRLNVYANTTAAPHREPRAIKAELVAQMTSPVLWQRCMENMRADGIEAFCEVGAGRVLTGLAKRIERRLPCITINSVEAASKAFLT